MPILNWNAEKVKNLTGMEIWLFIIGRLLFGFGVGVVGAHDFPEIVGPLGFPALLVGLLLSVVAAKGFWRSNSN
jgi:hypothetical protein